MRPSRWAGLGAVAGGSAAVVDLMGRGALHLDTGIGRRLRPLGPLRLDIAASPETVFDVVAEPYLHRTPRAMADKLEVCERGTDMVLAAHHTRTRWFTTTTCAAPCRTSSKRSDSSRHPRERTSSIAGSSAPTSGRSEGPGEASSPTGGRPRYANRSRASGANPNDEADVTEQLRRLPTATRPGCTADLGVQRVTGRR